MNNILRIVVAAIAASLFFAWVAPALAQPAAGAYRSLQDGMRMIFGGFEPVVTLSQGLEKPVEETRR